MRVLVTGAGGFLGGEIARRLAAQGAHEVVLSTRRPSASARPLDLAERAGVERGLAEIDPDVVVHAAGRSRGTPEALLADNALATANLARAISAACPRAGLILLGSAAQYGAGEPGRRLREDDPCLPQSPYGISKQAAEACAFAEARRSGLRVAVLRLFNVVAPATRGEQVFAHFLRKANAAAAAAAPPWRVPMGPLDAVRDFVPADDVATAVARAIDRGAWGGAINVCTGVGRSARALIDAVNQALDGALQVEEGGEAFAGSSPWSVGDPALCEERLGFRPSADLAPLVRAAAAIIREEAGAHARSGA